MTTPFTLMVTDSDLSTRELTAPFRAVVTEGTKVTFSGWCCLRDWTPLPEPIEGALWSPSGGRRVVPLGVERSLVNSLQLMLAV